MPGTKLTRRDFAQRFAIFVGTPLLVRCTSGGVPVVGAFVGPIEAIGQQIQLDAPQIQAVVATVPAYAGQAATIAATVTGIDSQVEAAAAAIGEASTQAQGQSTLITIETFMNTLAPIIGPPLEAAASAAFPGGGLVVALVIAALPAIEPLVNMAVDQLTAEAKALAAYAPTAATAALNGHTVNSMGHAQMALAELRRRAGK